MRTMVQSGQTSDPRRLHGGRLVRSARPLPYCRACMIPLLRGVTYPARPTREEIVLGFTARTRDNP
jgi:hypothetical protein